VDIRLVIVFGVLDTLFGLMFFILEVGSIFFDDSPNALVIGQKVVLLVGEVMNTAEHEYAAIVGQNEVAVA
jgi:hypothetical protein